MVYREKTPDGTTRLTGSHFNAIDAWPVGSVFIGYTSTSPATLLGGGTWTSFGSGRVLLGVDSADPDFDTIGEVGGEKTHTLTLSEIPAHAHTNSHTHDIKRSSSTGTSGTTVVRGGAEDVGTGTTTNASSATGQNGGDGAHNNMPPYVVVRFWRRTA